MKKIILWTLVFVLNIFMVYAHGEATFEEAEELIESKISCDELTDDQLEIIGEYYMEQMHPGEAHEEMDEMMGGEGSESLREMHINMARSFYCGESEMMGSSMMNTMMGRSMGSSNMMSSGTKDYDYKKQGGMMNLMGYYGVFGFLFMILFWGLIIWLIVWIVTQATKKAGKTESAVEILKKRFAKGELTKKQFEEMRKELK